MSDTVHRLDALRAAATAGRISRRSFIEGVVLLGATVPAALSLWWKDVAAATPKMGGRFRLGPDDGNTIESMDPRPASRASFVGGDGEGRGSIFWMLPRARPTASFTMSVCLPRSPR